MRPEEVGCSLTGRALASEAMKIYELFTMLLRRLGDRCSKDIIIPISDPRKSWETCSESLKFPSLSHITLECYRTVDFKKRWGRKNLPTTPHLIKDTGLFKVK